MLTLFATLSTSLIIYMAFALWWFLLLEKKLEQDIQLDLNQFHRKANKPFGVLYILHFAAMLLIALMVPHAMSTWLQFFVFGLGSIITTYSFQTFLIYPWHKKLAGETPERFLKSVLAYVRLTAALLAPFFIFQLLNATLIDPPDVGIDAVETLVLNLGRIVVLSLFTIVFSVMFMLRMIPNSKVDEKEYLDQIGKRLNQIGWADVRLRWIDIPNFNNAFVVGFKWFGFSNQTMFIGRSLRDLLTRDEFDAVICHELGHMANGHLLKRITYAMALLFGLILSFVTSLLISGLLTFVLSDDPATSSFVFGLSLMITLILSYVLIVSWTFKNYRQQEHEADAFAVMKLGIKLEDLEKSLRKVANKFRAEANREKIWNPFNTHPEIETRIENVKNKISLGVEYDWNQSVISRLLEITFRAASPRAMALGFTLFILTGLLIHTNVTQNKNYLLMVERGSVQELQEYRWHHSHINSRLYLIFGVTPIEVATYKKNIDVVKFLVAKGADVSKGSGFNSAIDIAYNQKNWELLNYLLIRVSDQWLVSNSQRLLKNSLNDETGQGLKIFLEHKLHKHLSPEDLSRIVDRAQIQNNPTMISALSAQGLIGPKRLPASHK